MSNTTTAAAPAAVLSIRNANKMSLDEAKAMLVDREIEYYADKSSVNECGNRLFRVVSLDRVCDSNKTGLRYVTAHVIDRDCGDVPAIKALNLCSICVL